MIGRIILREITLLFISTIGWIGGYYLHCHSQNQPDKLKMLPIFRICFGKSPDNTYTIGGILLQVASVFTAVVFTLFIFEKIERSTTGNLMGILVIVLLVLLLILKIISKMQFK